MSTETEQQPQRERSIIYIITIVVLVILAVIALITFLSARQEAQATDKAEQFLASLDENGIDTDLTAEQVARVLGDDGGGVCANPNDALSKAILFERLTNGAAGPGQRPIIAQDNVVEGQLLIIETYCPDELEDFQQFVDDLQLSGGDGS
ncbi:type II secretory pathway pseudopilin PulG [Agromyces flavus]|uniref:Type II secretory pathway pseudopilin PulG n=1 Tax=Agromyces flavus TaxID=589382 RepID=A0A1H1Z221_9MICO|nr:hypothetical protein [Agromyces flavus]MCP2366896.1 type II secretory pathway pseudopilin PulG [Agromyces flavus]GGI46804.1 hypothetical protein GCM10010932_16470 [Agromyces flavus]SDT27835.1 hypothetical protein SAMN04489721_2974 [Agromyces flavus]